MHILQKGDVVDIIVPASGCSLVEYDGAINFVREFGLQPKFRPFAEVIKPGLCANSAEYRFKHLMEALESDSKAIWCLKGGYGSQQLLTRLDAIKPPVQEKIFIGFSDITMLLNYFAAKWGWVCLHGPMPAQVGKISADSWKNLAEVLFGEQQKCKISATSLNKTALAIGQVKGKLFGGCLSLMQALIGTSHMPNLTGSILLLEDDKFETERRIDRIFNHMQRAEIFKGLKAVLVGNFLESNEIYTNELREILTDLGDYLDNSGIPLLQNKQLGHCNEMLTVPVGGDLEINVE